jgi:hypothetical protein
MSRPNLPRPNSLEKPTCNGRHFDGFTYTVKVGQKLTMLMHCPRAAAELPKERTPGKDEKAEDKDKLQGIQRKAKEA